MASAPASATLPPGTFLRPGLMIAAGMVLALSNFMVVLDLTIANVSVPHIAGNLGISLDQGTWIVTSYAVAEAVCVPLTGWLAQRFGTVRVFLLAMAGFGVFSLLCGLSQSLMMIVVCRIGQGLCGGPIMPMSQALMVKVFPPNKQGMAMGLWAMTTLLGPALGPIVGGYISDSFSWHWIFLINIPIAIACTFAGSVLLTSSETETHKLPIDRVGLCLLIFWIGCLQVMLDIGRDHDWFADPLILALAGMAAIGFLVFIIWELTEEHPIVNLRVFRHPGFSFSVSTLALCFGAYFASIVIIPQWLQVSLGYPATLAGIVTALTAVSAITTAQLVTKLMVRYDARALTSGAVVWLGIMSLMRARWTSGIDFWSLAESQFYQGFAMSFMMIPLTSSALGAVPPEETASAAGLQNFLRTMSIAVSTSLALTIWGNAQRVARSEVVGSLHPEATQAALAAAGMPADQVPQVITNLVEQEAMVLAVDHTFLITAGVLFFAAIVVWMGPRPKALMAAGAAGH